MNVPNSKMLETARACLQSGDINAAERLIGIRLKHFPADAQALHFMGALAIYGENFDRGVGYFNQALRNAQDDHVKAMCWNGLGYAFTGLTQPQRAQEAFRRARLLDPFSLNYAYDLATALVNARQTLLAIETLRSAAQQHPQNAEVCVRLGNVLVQASRFDEALELFQEASNRDPTNASAYFNASVALAILGQAREAVAACDLALRLDPNLNAYYQLASLGGLDHDARRLAVVERRAASNSRETLASQVDACFAAARVYDRMQDYNRAFEYLHKGNRLKRSTLDFSVDNEVRRIETIIGFFGAGFVSRFTGQIQSDLQPIFIVGMPRSGSTLLEQMLAAHPAIEACGELNYMTNVAHDMGVRWWPQTASAPRTDEEILSDLECAAQKYRRSVNSRGEPLGRFTDKMPSNFLLLGLAHLLFPGAVLLHIRRNPMDTCLSCYDHLFTSSIPYAYDLVELGRYYRLYQKIMDHWQAVLPSKRILDVQYEVLVEEPETEIRRILEHCGLSFNPRCLQFHTLQRPVNTASHVQVRKPLYRSAIGRWRYYASHLGPLSDALRMD